MRWVGHVDVLGQRRSVYRFVVEKPEVRDHLEDPGADGRSILR